VSDTPNTTVATIAWTAASLGVPFPRLGGTRGSRTYGPSLSQRIVEACDLAALDALAAEALTYRDATPKSRRTWAAALAARRLALRGPAIPEAPLPCGTCGGMGTVDSQDEAAAVLGAPIEKPCPACNRFTEIEVPRG
jgi:hypothetical protein